MIWFLLWYIRQYTHTHVYKYTCKRIYSHTGTHKHTHTPEVKAVEVVEPELVVPPTEDVHLVPKFGKILDYLEG